MTATNIFYNFVGFRYSPPLANFMKVFHCFMIYMNDGGKRYLVMVI